MLLMGIYGHIHDVTAAGTFGKDTQFLEDITSKLTHSLRRHQFGLNDSLSAQEQEMYGYTLPPECKPLEIHTSDNAEFWFMGVSPYYKVYFKENTVRMDIGNAWIKYEVEHVKTVIQNQEENQLGTEDSRIPNIAESVVEQNTLAVSNVFEAVDVSYTVDTSVLTEKFVLREFKQVNRVVQKMDWGGVTPEYQEDGSIIFFNEKGDKIVQLLPPYMEDASQNICENVHYEIIETESGYELHKVIDEKGLEWLKNAVYPVVLDPSMQTFEDAWESSGLTPYGQYFKNLKEFVNPANGLLTVTHTDLTIPGRGLDVTLSRVYQPPAVFYGSDPYDYEAPPVNVGNGWQLNFPYIGSKYVHLWGGSVYKIVWSGNTFENHTGTHFTLVKNGDLTYTLTMANGTVYEFNTTGYLTEIEDLDQNSITFSYTSGNLTSITDTIGRTVNLNYSDGKLWKIVYNNEEIEFSYDSNGCLQWTEDFLNRRTSYYYNSGYNNWLLSKIEYPTSGYTTYYYNRYSDNDYYKYHVTNQKVYETNQVRHNVFSYTGSFSDITASETAVKNESDIVKGFYSFVIDDGIITQRMVKNASGEPLKKFVYTHNARHEVEKVDVYNDGSTLSYTTYFAYDNWGNTIYAKNAQGHEQFFSYANTSTSGYFIDNTGTIVKEFTNAFSNCTVHSSVHTAVIGMAEKQDATYVKEAYYTYDLNGHVTDTETSFGSSTTWLTYSGTFDEYTGDTSFEIDLTGHTVTGNGVLKITGKPSTPTYQESHSYACEGQCGSGCKGTSGSWCWSNKYYHLYYECCNYEYPPGEVVCHNDRNRNTYIGPFTYYPGSLGYQNYYTTPGLDNIFNTFTVTTRWKAYPAQVKYNINGSDWTTISENLKDTTLKITVPGLTNDQNTLYFTESSSKKTKFSWWLYIPVDNTPDSYTTSMQYDTYGNITSVTDPESHTITFTYASEYSHAYMTEISASTGSETITTKATYDYNRGWITSMQEPKGVAESGYDTVYTYDVLGRLIKKEFPLLDGQSERSYMEAVYDCENRKVTVIDALGHYVTKEFDKLGRLTATKWYTGQFGQGTLYTTKSYRYYYNNKVKTVTDFGNDTRTYTYDFLGRNTDITFSDSSVVSYSYDDTNNIMTFTNSRDYERKYWFDWGGQLIKVKEEYEPGIFTQTVYQYDEIGNLTSVTDAESHTTNYEYTSLFGVTKIIYPDLSYEEFDYDAMGNLISFTNGTGDTTTYSYDSVYRLTQVEYPDMSTVSFTYDLNGNRIKMDDNAPNTGDYAQYTYDTWNRVMTETRYTAQNVYTTQYGYDNMSRLTDITYPDDTHIVYSYDDLNRITQVKQYIDGIHDEILQDNIQYNNKGLLTQFHYGNELQTAFLYDSRKRPLKIDVTDGETQFLNLDYTWDSNSNITELVNGWRDTDMDWHSNTEVYTYDGLDRLTSATSSLWSHTYQYDKTGNRISKDSTTYTINSVNQVTEISDGTTFDYDLIGNMIQKVKGTDTWDYTYDYANKLTEIKKNSTVLGEYTYDGDGKRIQVTENNETTFYVYSGINVLYEKTSTGTACYIYGSGGQIAKITKTQGESHIFYYHTDHLGSTRLVTDESQHIIAAAVYEPFGQSITEGEESFLYTGKEKDETGLYYYGARYYDPELGRFIIRDPLAGKKIAPQSLNRYTYCLNNPVKFIDPAGMFYKMCLVEGGCRWVRESRSSSDPDRPDWVAYNANGDIITDSNEMEDLITSEDPAKQAKAVFLVLLITHPEIQGDPTQTPKLMYDGGFRYEVTIEGEKVYIWITIMKECKSEKDHFADTILTGWKEKNGDMVDMVKIIVYQAAFQSYAHLYHVIGHEGVHAYELAVYGSTTEENAYKWNLDHAYNPVPYPWDIGHLILLYRHAIAPYLPISSAIPS